VPAFTQDKAGTALIWCHRPVLMLWIKGELPAQTNYLLRTK